MLDLQAEFGITYMLISHDLAVVDHLCDEVAVIYPGRIVEQGPPERLFRAAAHPYTRALLDAVPRAEPGARAAAAPPRPRGSQIGSQRRSAGCAFADRCASCRSLPRRGAAAARVRPGTARHAIMPSA